MRYVPQYHTACQIQKLILDQMGLELQPANRVPKPGENKKALKPSELCSLTKAWTELEERKRILRMKPKPKDIEVKSAPSAKMMRPTFTE